VARARHEDSHEHNLETVNGCNMIFGGGAWTITVMQLSVDATSVAVNSLIAFTRQLLTPTILSLALDIPRIYTSIQLE